MFYNGFEQLAEGDFLIMLYAKFTILKCRNILARNRNTLMDPSASLKITFKCFLRSTMENLYHKYKNLHAVHLFMTNMPEMVWCWEMKKFKWVFFYSIVETLVKSETKKLIANTLKEKKVKEKRKKVCKVQYIGHAWKLRLFRSRLWHCMLWKVEIEY